MFNLQRAEHLNERLQKDQELLNPIHSYLPDLERLLVPFQVMYEDGIYRFYHHSFKVYQLQAYTSNAVDIFKRIADANSNQLCEWFEEIVAAGTGVTWEPEHNHSWR